MRKVVLAIDQGTTGTTVIVVDRDGRIVSKAYSEFTQIYPKPGWVEHDPEEIWQITMKVIQDAIEDGGLSYDQVAGIGITNQRETTVVWDRKSGKPIHNAIVWQCRRTSQICEQLKAAGHQELFQTRTGLVIDAHFSGTKIKWLLNNVPEARQKAEAGELLFGTIDTWLVWNLTRSRTHVTDYTNAARTLIFNINQLKWDDETLGILEIPENMLPQAKASSEIFGVTEPSLPFKREIPIAGIAGDQQAALFGQACWTPGMIKNTYGTGCLISMYMGKEPALSTNGLLTTLCCDPMGKPAYALEGSVSIAGAAVQWLRDEVKLIDHAAESELAAMDVTDTSGAYFVPAFSGLGAPYWDMDARGAIVGLTRDVNRNHIIRAALEAIAYQTRDVIEMMVVDAETPVTELRVDGAASANNFLMQFQADILDVTIERPEIIETAALGAAFLAGLAVDVWKSPEDLEVIRLTERKFSPKMGAQKRHELYSGWKKAVSMVQSH